MKILTILKMSLSKVIQALASGSCGTAFFVGFYYAFMSTDPSRYWIAGSCLAVLFLSYLVYKYAILKIYDDR